MNTKEKFEWASKDPKSLTEEFIDHIYEDYYKSYLYESERYERLNNRFFLSITALGFLVTLLIGLKGIFQKELEHTSLDKVFTVLAFILPSVSSLLLLYWTQKGYKRKEEIREEARIECKFMVNEARIRFSKSKDDPEAYESLYKWINDQVRQLQLSQAKGYFLVHNNRDKPTSE